MPTTYPDFLPLNVARSVITAATEGSVLLRNATVRRMAAGQERLPIRTVNPVAEFVSSQYGGRKPLSELVYEHENLTVEEVALTVAIPDAFLADASFNVDADVEAAFAEAIAKAVDLAGLHGIGSPVSWPASGLIGLAGVAVQPSAGGTIAEALDLAFAKVENAGGMPDTIIASPRLRSALRSYASVEGQLADPSDVYGVAPDYTKNWPADPDADALVGDFTGVIVGIREDIRIRKSQDAVLQDGTGAIVVNAFQDDSTAYRAYMRVGMVVPGIPTGLAEGELNYALAAVERDEAAA